MFERILVAVDRSETSGRAVREAAEMGARFGAELAVLHVHEQELSWVSDTDSEIPTEATSLVDGVVRELQDVGVSARAEVRRAPHRLVPTEILRAASDVEAQLIVMGTRGLTDRKGPPLGSVAHNVRAHSTCPVLLVSSGEACSSGSVKASERHCF
jgi:nucleotide-binding universal stress UspA family protein